MTNANAVPRSVKIIRWIARIWSVLVTVFILLIFFAPFSGGPGPIAAVDQFLLSLTGVALLGLFVAWRWELVGGIFTIAMLFLREIAWVILKGNWLLGFLILWVLIAPPAVLFLIAWRLERKTKELLVRCGWLKLLDAFDFTAVVRSRGRAWINLRPYLPLPIQCHSPREAHVRHLGQ